MRIHQSTCLLGIDAALVNVNWVVFGARDHETMLTTVVWVGENVEDGVDLLRVDLDVRGSVSRYATKRGRAQAETLAAEKSISLAVQHRKPTLKPGEAAHWALLARPKMAAWATAPVPTMFLSTYSCHDMIAGRESESCQVVQSSAGV